MSNRLPVGGTPGADPPVSVPEYRPRIAMRPPSLTRSTISTRRSSLESRRSRNPSIALALSLPIPGNGGECSVKPSESTSSACFRFRLLKTSSMNRRAISLASSGVAMSHPSRRLHGTELHHQLRHLHLRPRLGYLAVGLVPRDLHPLQVDFRIVCRDPEPRKTPRVRPGVVDPGEKPPAPPPPPTAAPPLLPPRRACRA